MRLLLSSTLLVTALLGPFFATTLLMAVGLLYYPRYWEAVAVAFLVEILYRTGRGDLLSMSVSFTLAVLIAFVLVEGVRRFIRTRN